MNYKSKIDKFPALIFLFNTTFGGFSSKKETFTDLLKSVVNQIMGFSGDFRNTAHMFETNIRVGRII